MEKAGHQIHLRRAPHLVETTGDKDAALLPLGKLQDLPPGRPIPFGIAAYGKVHSVKLAATVPISQVSQWKYDPESTTAWRLWEKIGFPTPPAQSPHVGQLIIGEKALQRKWPYEIDLGYHHYRLYRRPFVFAIWWAYTDKAYQELPRLLRIRPTPFHARIAQKIYQELPRPKILRYWRRIRYRFRLADFYHSYRLVWGKAY
ncbi:MAG: MqnA/MqnD/SBP family protein [Bacteroidia bacterium]